MQCDIRKMKILVVGEVFLDKNLVGKSDRLSPEAPVPVIYDCNCSVHLGGAANVAKNISKLGAQVSLLTLFGDDQYATTLKSMLIEHSVNILETKIKTKATIRKERYIVNQQQILRHDIEKKIDVNASIYIANYIYDICSNFDMVVITDYNKGLLKSTVTEKIKLLNKSKPILLDSKSCSDYLLKGATLYKPNFPELNFICDRTSLVLDSTEEKLDYIMRNYKIPNLLLTLGDKGMVLVSRNEDKIIKTNLPVFKRDVYDVTGAGDTVISVVAFCMLKGNSILQSAKTANYIASKAVTFLGTYTPTKKDLADASGKTVFTNGCFDILHIGHIKLLESCKSHGSKLIVGLNSDESVKRLKGKSRPFNSENARKEILENIESVDEVIIFEEDTPYELIKKIQPDIIVKGGDYKSEDIIGKDIVEANGGRVEIFPFISNYSTSKLAERIRNNA